MAALGAGQAAFLAPAVTAHWCQAHQGQGLVPDELLSLRLCQAHQDTSCLGSVPDWLPSLHKL